MIIKMQKYSFLVFHSDYEAFLGQLKSLGVLHIIASANEPTPQMQENLRKIQEIKRLIDFLSSRKRGETALLHSNLEHGEPLLNSILETRARLEAPEQQKMMLEKEVRQFEPWGHFLWESVNRLQEGGISMRFFQCAESRFKAEWEQDYAIEVISSVNNQICFVVFQSADQPDVELDADEVKLPYKSLEGIKMELHDVETLISNLNQQLDDFAHYAISPLQSFELELKDRLQTEMAMLHTNVQADGVLMQLEGFVPQPKIPELETFLQTTGAVYVSDLALIDDKPPILLKNNGFARLFEPIGKLFELPAYMELDITPFFAPFFMLFFGFCLGDAGYGLLLALVATVAKPKLKKELRPYLSLVQFLGLGTMVMGSLTGTLFGAKMSEVDWPFIANIQKMMLSDSQMFNLALGLGFIQIIFGMILKGINESIQSGFRYSFSIWGWIIVIVSSAAMYAVDALWGSVHLSLLGISALGIFVFNHPKRNILINVGAGLWDTYNMVTGFLGDILSYIRLFALGLAGGILGFVFNKLAFDLSPDIPVLGFIITGLILIVGHSLNIFMSALGAFVHPMRLTFVEFYKNSGFIGGGKAYSPFK